MSAYSLIVVKSFNPVGSSEVHVRPVPGQTNFPTSLRVTCSRSLVRKYPIGTKFRIKGNLGLMKGVPYVYSRYSWSYEVLC